MKPADVPESWVQGTPPTKNQTLRILALPLLILVIVESAVGGSLALEGSTYSMGYLTGHVGLAALLVLLSAWALIVSLRLSSRPAQVAAGITLLACLGATIAGTLFLIGGQSVAALEGMEGSAGLALLSTIFLFVWGSIPNPVPPRVMSG